MTLRNYITAWNHEGERIKLRFLDGSILYVTKTDFDRTFGCIINLTKEEVEKDFAIQDISGKIITAQMLMQYLTYQAVTRCTNTTTPVNDVPFTVTEIQEAIWDIESASQSYLQYRADTENGETHELAG